MLHHLGSYVTSGVLYRVSEIGERFVQEVLYVVIFILHPPLKTPTSYTLYFTHSHKIPQHNYHKNSNTTPCGYHKIPTPCGYLKIPVSLQMFLFLLSVYLLLVTNVGMIGVGGWVVGQHSLFRSKPSLVQKQVVLKTKSLATRSI